MAAPTPLPIHSTTCEGDHRVEVVEEEEEEEVVEEEVEEVTCV